MSNAARRRPAPIDGGRSGFSNETPQGKGAEAIEGLSGGGGRPPLDSRSPAGIARAGFRVGSWVSVLEVGKEYHLRYYTKEEFDARVTAQTANGYMIQLKGPCSLGRAGEVVGVEKRLLKLLKEI